MDLQVKPLDNGNHEIKFEVPSDTEISRVSVIKKFLEVATDPGVNPEVFSERFWRVYDCMEAGFVE